MLQNLGVQFHHGYHNELGVGIEHLQDFNKYGYGFLNPLVKWNSTHKYGHWSIYLRADYHSPTLRTSARELVCAALRTGNWFHATAAKNSWSGPPLNSSEHRTHGAGETIADAMPQESHEFVFESLLCNMMPCAKFVLGIVAATTATYCNRHLQLHPGDIASIYQYCCCS